MSEVAGPVHGSARGPVRRGDASERQREDRQEGTQGTGSVRERCPMTRPDQNSPTTEGDLVVSRTRRKSRRPLFLFGALGVVVALIIGLTTVFDDLWRSKAMTVQGTPAPTMSTAELSI